MLINDLIKQGWLKTPKIIQAFQEIKRYDFMPENIKHLSELNEALPIGKGQTISQPLTVAFMLEQLQPMPGDKILDIGSGSGWTTSLLAHIVGPKGKIIAIEIVPELKEFGEKNVTKYNFIKKGIVKFICGDGSRPYKQKMFFDKILVSASLFLKKRNAAVIENLPLAWKKQLKINGRIVAPIENSIWLFIKKKRGFEEIEYPGFAFVPLVED